MKAPTFWKTYVALALAAGLGAYIYFVEAKRPEPTEEKPKEKVFTLDRAKVKAVTLDAAEGDDIRLVKEKDQWRMTAPLEAPAASAEIDSLITSVESLEVEAVAMESPTAVTEYGLLVALVAILLIGVVTIFGSSITSWFKARTEMITTIE